MQFPDSGTYVVPDGLSTLQIDLRDSGIYVEPHVLMQHQERIAPRVSAGTYVRRGKRPAPG